MKIIKRDGTIVDYDAEKIKIAIQKANEEVQGREKISKEQIKEIIKNEMENAINLKVPLIADVSEAYNWYECK